jgi:hypothetical protein
MQIQNNPRLVWALLATLWLGAHTIPAAAADGDQYLGKWSGTYQGDNTSGHFELILERGSAGLITGTIAVSGDGGGATDYNAKLKSASFSGDTFTAAYDPPGDDQTQINMKGTFNPKGGDGDWSVSAKAQPSSPPVASGTWKIIKQ